MKFIAGLEELGIPKNEARTYTELLHTPRQTAYELSKRLGMDRTLVYQVLSRLIERGLVHYRTEEKKKIFSATNPQHLLEPIKTQELLAQTLIQEAKKIQPQEQHDHHITVYEGKQGLQTIFTKSLMHKEFYSFGGTGKGAEVLLYETPHYLKKAQEQGVDVKIIFGTHVQEKIIQNKYTQYVQARFLDVHAEATTTIWGDNIAIHLLTGKPLIIHIQNKEIARSYRNYFQYLWERAQLG